MELPGLNVRVCVCHMKTNLFSNPILWENHVVHLRGEKRRGPVTHPT